MVNPEAILDERLGKAFAAVAGAPADPVLRRSQHADYQADGALTLAKRLGRRPRDLASAIVERASLDDVCAKVEVVGPGFINLTVADHVLSAMTSEMSAHDRLGVAPTEEPETVVVDYSAPNAAKEMHFGHLRSTIIGDAAVRSDGRFRAVIQ